MSTVRAIGLIVLSSLMSTAGQTLLKLGLDSGAAGKARSVIGFLRSAFGEWQVWLGLVLFAASVLIWMRVLSSAQLSWGYPLLGLSYVFVALSGHFIFREQLDASRMIGIGLVLVGAAFIARS